ncbi:rhodanese-like domain-containing protein [Actinobacillus delphinicola]|uniref:Rhodanese domain-containing protein n=1 Tax=Actinobacillus delphinicola TaxID=51161 RepID=A0A448TSZ9_9PAST|nr:rhodanese-like domain-containing protein [Actinobacillus delphinicola]MDG6897205.1 rhodanese-like domain-containing protein [Actinobacillus delphinicola]VEJ09025.1 rhodanese domain-containing protein [Actinobacillus delphinicola]
MQGSNLQEFLPQAIEFAKNHSFLVIAWIVLFVMTIYFFYKDGTRKFKIIENDDAIRLMNTKDAVLIDLRPMEDFQRGHIVGSLNILPQEIKEDNIGKLEKYKSSPVIIIDQVGMGGINVAKSAETLVKLGFADVYILREGIVGWNSANLPLVTKK